MYAVTRVPLAMTTVFAMHEDKHGSNREKEHAAGDNSGRSWRQSAPLTFGFLPRLEEQHVPHREDVLHRYARRVCQLAPSAVWVLRPQWRPRPFRLWRLPLRLSL